MTSLDHRPRSRGAGAHTASRRWPVWLVVGLAVLFAAVIVAGRALSGPGSSTPLPGHAQGIVTAAPAPTGQGIPGTGVAPTLLDVDQTVPMTTPADVDWLNFQGVWLPYTVPVLDHGLVNEHYAGPAHTEGPAVNGYAQTPLGALLAAEQIGVRYLLTPADGWRQVTEQQTTGTLGQQAWIKVRAQTPDSFFTGTPAQSAGFRFLGYTRDVVSLQLVYAQSDGTLAVNSVVLDWIDEDWKLRLQANGTTSPALSTVPSLAGFVPFAEV